KRDELVREQARRKSLLSQADNMDHTCNIHGNHEDWNCSKCRLSKEATDMSIQVFEWPLPDDCVQAEAVVFELNAPSDFKIWRDLTYQILFYDCRSDSTNSSSFVQCKLF